MTNITLSIDDAIHKRMRRYSELKWSELVRKAIKKRLEELESLDKNPEEEGVLTMLASENVLKRDWNNEYDKRWDNV